MLSILRNIFVKTAGEGKSPYYEAVLFDAAAMSRRWRGGLADRDRFAEASTVNRGYYAKRKNAPILKGEKTKCL